MSGHIGAPGSPARFLSENINTIPADHQYALVGMGNGGAYLIMSGTKKKCQESATDLTKMVVCELGKYRQEQRIL